MRVDSFRDTAGRQDGLPDRIWRSLPEALRSWLFVYAGPLLGVLVVLGLLWNLDLQTGPGTGPAAGSSASFVQSPESVTEFSEDGLSARRVETVYSRRPRSLKLSDGTTVPVLPAGTTAAGKLDVPDDIRKAGWWRGGARIGDPFGSMLIAAHIDSKTQGLGPYAVLLEVKPGDRFVVSSTNLTQTFKVTERRIVARDKLTTVPDIFSPRGEPRLTMVTCAGPYVKADGGYQNLAVVTAMPVGGPKTQA